ncbi:uncharacterized protein LOC107221579 isoform X1 [Neodiprion lecontei]|uniref:Uncharacterized protein LOC107221579 isoform X1 n=1 Tax=Neodiprion lecontei TaxID=441921 RepID=A0ABM3FYT4_NEOLC|nr:uncharacterized protein LOC107221579 isoform X1 [Neodiprion lecontei]
MQLLVAFILLGCCVVAHSVPLSDSLAVEKVPDSEAKRSFTESEGAQLSESRITRTKRSGGGSGGFLAGIGSAILGKVAEASSGASTGSSDGSGKSHQYESVEYGPPVHDYDEKNFDVWSFKKAILNTLFQALKAIGGGVIALKGKLIKGGGIVVSAKGNIISAKGEAITSLGRHIAASAVLTPPKPVQHYHYEPPAHVPVSGHDSYAGPPPSAYGHHGGYAAHASPDSSYGHTAYASPSDDADNPGLVIVKPAEDPGVLPASDQDEESSPYPVYKPESEHHHHHHEVELITPRHPPLSALSESFGGNQKDSGSGSGIDNLISQISSASSSSSQSNKHREEHREEHHEEESDHHHHRHNQEDEHADPPKLDFSSLALPAQFGRPHFGKSPFDFGMAPFGAGHEGLDDGFVMMMFPKPVVEVPVLHSHGPRSYLPPSKNYIHEEFGSLRGGPLNYGPLTKRSGVGMASKIGEIRIVPSIGYMLKGSRAFRG